MPLPSSADPHDPRDSIDPVDRAHLRRALRLAARGRATASPNPMVGALVVRGARVLGTGWHRRAGGPHAEVEALAEAGRAARGATLYVTLEPCSHHGRTPPCVDAILAAGIARVVACHRDPDPRVRGRGFARLRRRGVAVEVGLLGEEAARLNWRFVVASHLRRPAVTLKWAMSLDGRIATAAGESRWISSPAARHWALELREEHDAILVGSGTALADDPRLNRRLSLAGAPNLRVVLDRRLRLSGAAAMLSEPGPVLVYTESASRAKRVALELGGATVALLPEVAPATVLADLFARGVRSLLVEGGSGVLAAFVTSGLYDRVQVVTAPLLVGGVAAPGPLGGSGLGALAQAPRLENLASRRLGNDLLLSAEREGLRRDLRAAARW